MTTMFASVPDLRDLLGLEADMEDPKAVLVLLAATAAVRAYTGQRIALVENDSVDLAGNSSGKLELPEKPVVSVASVLIDHIATDYFVDARGDLIFGLNSALSTLYGPDPDIGHWGTPASIISVVYTHGFSVIPDEIRAATLMIASRLWERPGDAGAGLSAETIGQYAYRLGTATATRGLIGAEQTLLDPYKAKRVYSTLT